MASKDRRVSADRMLVIQIVATIDIASRLRKCRPTGMLNARANFLLNNTTLSEPAIPPFNLYTMLCIVDLHDSQNDQTTL